MSKFCEYDFRAAYRGHGVAWPGLENDDPKPEGWPYMSMQDAAKLSSQLVNAKPDTSTGVIYGAMSVLAWSVAAMAVVLMSWYWPELPRNFDIAFAFAVAALATIITGCIWSDYK